MKKDTLFQLGNTPFDLSVLGGFYPDTKHISDKARRLEQEGRIIRLKRGIYVRSAEDGAQPVVELIANHLYGPSYVSMQSALRHYGLIPERVYAIQSMTIKHSRSFDTPLGHYDYLSCPVGYFPIGIHQHQEGNAQFLIASPEKALCDLLVKTHRLEFDSTSSLYNYLENDLRFDCTVLKTFNLAILNQCCENTTTKKNNISVLTKLVENGQ
ncbi:MAG: hypothetical protein K6G25_03800 [Bacteroidales bacterium]|nr:hypothetical protein [Bacteroidales bacterium]